VCPSAATLARGLQLRHMTSEKAHMTLALIVPAVGIVILLSYFVLEGTSVDPWGRRRQD